MATKQIKVCYVTTLPYTLRWFLLDSIAYLKEKENWDITVICTDTEDFEKELPEGVRYIPVTMKRGFSIAGFSSLKKLNKIFKQEHFDIVQYSTSNAGCYAGIAAVLNRVPIRIYGQWGLDHIYFKGIKRFIYRVIERTICLCSTHVQPDSFDTLKVSIEDHLYPPKKGCVIGYGSACGVDMNRFDIQKKPVWNRMIRNRHNIPEEAFVFGFVGRIIGQKGINELIEATKNILDSGEQSYLLLIGPLDRTDGVSDELLSWAKSCDSIILTDCCDTPEHYYAAMNCFVFPSYREGFGSAVIEAEAMGVPVVSSDIPGPREAMLKNKTGIMVAKEDEKALEDAMLYAISNPDLMKEYGIAGYDYVKKHFEQNYLFEEIRKNRVSLLNALEE